MILPDTDNSGARELAENIRSVVSILPIPLKSGGAATVTVSIGLTTRPAIGIDSAEELIGLADNALYRSKKSGRNQVVFTD